MKAKKGADRMTAQDRATAHDVLNRADVQEVTGSITIARETLLKVCEEPGAALAQGDVIRAAEIYHATFNRRNRLIAGIVDRLNAEGQDNDEEQSSKAL